MNHGCMAMKLKSKPNHPNGNRFASIKEIKENSKQDLFAIPNSAFQKSFENGKKYWHKFITSIARLGPPNTSTTDEHVEAVKKMILDNQNNQKQNEKKLKSNMRNE